MRWFFRHFWLPFYRRWALRYIRKQQTFRYKQLRLQVPPEVFHPGIFFSTPIFLDFLQKIDFQNKKTLDVGTGSGILALFAAQQRANTFALDINPKAVETARQNAEDNGLKLETWISDLFDNCPVRLQFDFILINPPFYAQNPNNKFDNAFFAGEQLQYFEKLFRQLPEFIHPESRCWMILSEDCDLKKISDLAQQSRFQLNPVFQKWKWGEQFTIFQLDFQKK